MKLNRYLWAHFCLLPICWHWVQEMIGFGFLEAQPMTRTQCVSVIWHAAQTGVRGSYRHTGRRKKWSGIGKGAVRFLAQRKETWQRNAINKVMPSANYEIPGVRQTGRERGHG